MLTKISARRGRAAATTAAVLTCAVLLTGCATAVDGSAQIQPGAGGPSSSSHGSSSSSGSTRSSQSSSSSSASTPASSTDGAAGLTGEQLSAKIDQANTDVTSMIGSLSVQAGSTETVQASFSETLGGGKVTGIDMDMNLTASGQAFDLRILVKDGKVYISGDKFLTSLNVPSGKKWVLADPTSSNAQLASLGSTMSGLVDSSSTSQYTSLAKTAQDVKYKGQQTISGVKADEYTMTIDVSAAAAASTGQQQQQMQQLLSSGVKTLPMTLWVDQDGHLVQASEDFSAAGQKLHTGVSITSINSQVTITPPPASEVYDG